MAEMVRQKAGLYIVLEDGKPIGKIVRMPALTGAPFWAAWWSSGNYADVKTRSAGVAAIIEQRARWMGDRTFDWSIRRLEESLTPASTGAES